MPVLKQSGKIANDRLFTHLKRYRYAPVRHTPALWKHETRKIMFTLVENDLGIKFTSRQDAEHLVSALEHLYVITKDWEGTNILGLTLNWDYPKITVDVSIPKYVKAYLHTFHNPTPLRPQYSPHQCNRPTYGSATKYADPEDNLAPLTP